jgi:hypothetical protein
MPKWVRFTEMPIPGRKTNVWQVATIDAPVILGEIKFWPRWRKYAFFPLANTLYEKDCLRDIADFCEAETRNWRLKL